MNLIPPEFYKDPEIEIGSFSEIGEMTFEFSDKIIVPEGFVDLNLKTETLGIGTEE